MQYAYIYACVVYVWLGVIIRRGDEVLGRTMRRAVMDSLTHLFSSRRWPATRHTHSTAVNTQMDTTVPLLPPPVPPPTTTASDHHHHHAILAFPSLLLLLLSSRFFVSSSLSLLRVSLRWSGVTGDFGARRGPGGRLGDGGGARGVRVRVSWRRQMVPRIWVCTGYMLMLACLFWYSCSVRNAQTCCRLAVHIWQTVIYFRDHA